MNKNTAVCYRFYDEKSRRLALFCDFINETTAELVIIPCSKSDQFTKKEALNLYKKVKNSEVVPSAKILEIAVLPEERTLKTLFRYAYENLYQPKTIRVYTNKTKYIKVKNG